MVNVSDMMVGVKNLIESADIRINDQVLLLADTRSDPLSIDALKAGLIAHGACPSVLITEPIGRYGEVSKLVLDAIRAVDVAVWVWPVFISFTPGHRGMKRKREEVDTQLTAERVRPYFVYFEGNEGLLARDYAKFPNKILWKIAEKVKEVVSAGSTVRIEDDLGTDLTAAYDGNKLYGMQFRAGDPPGRCHFPWGRCGMYNGSGDANGVIYLSCVQGVAGRLAEPMRWEVKDGFVTDVKGGGDIGEETKKLFKKIPGSNKLVEIMFGYHPKASVAHGIADPMHWELISKMPWAGLGTPRHHPDFRHIDGSIMDGRLFIDGRLVIDKFGTLEPSLLYHKDVLAVASEYGDAEEMLAPVSHNAHGSGTLWRAA